MPFWRSNTGDSTVWCQPCGTTIRKFEVAAWNEATGKFYHIDCVPYGEPIYDTPDDYFGVVPWPKPKTRKDYLVDPTGEAVLKQSSYLDTSIDVDLWGTPGKIGALPLPGEVKIKTPVATLTYSKDAIDELLRPLVAPALVRVLLKVAGCGRKAKPKPIPADKDDLIAQATEARSTLLEFD